MIDYNEMEKEYSVHLFNKRDLVLVKGDNARVWDIDGNEYIDCTTGQGVASIGHSNAELVKAIKDQAEKIITCSGSFSNEKRALFMQKLIEITPENLTQVFLCNSGTESVEAALKFARFTTKKTGFICAMRNFHGRTLGALSATFTPGYKNDFEPLVPGFEFVPYNNFDKLKEKITESTAAILLESVQGEGGVNLGQKEYFQKVRQLCEDKDILLIIDEVQTGFCRTGKMFAFEHYKIKPDIICLAKAIAGGVPAGAVICSDKVKMQPGKHGTTFGGNPLACAAGLAAIEFMQKEGLANQASEKGEYFTRKFSQKDLTRVREIRQIGLMIGIELKEKVQPFISALQKEGILALPAGPTILRLMPPLTIEYEQLDFVIEKIHKILS